MTTYYTDGNTATIYVYEDGHTPASNLGLTEITNISEFIAAQKAALPIQPNANGFLQALKTTLGGILGANTLMANYPAFVPAVQELNWPDVSALLADAASKNVITATQVAAIKTAASDNAIPVTLP